MRFFLLMHKFRLYLGRDRGGVLNPVLAA
jgi:hypothetical protein